MTPPTIWHKRLHTGFKLSINLLFQPKKTPPHFPRQPNDYSARLPRGWEDYLSPGDQQWVGHYVCNGVDSPERFKDSKQLWHYPPKQDDPTIKPKPGKQFLRRLFLWMPYRGHNLEIECPNCPKKRLSSRGIYNKMRQVLDQKDYYWLGTEMLECGNCKKLDLTQYCM